MTLNEIKKAVDDGHNVYWKNPMYKVIRNGLHYDIECSANGSCTGLTWLDGVTMDYKLQDFFMTHSDSTPNQANARLPDDWRLNMVEG